MTARPEYRPTTKLLWDAVRFATDLLRGEMDLARAELDRNLRRAAGGAILLAMALVPAIVALNVLAGAVVATLVTDGFGPIAAALVVAAALAFLAIVMVLVGRHVLTHATLMPGRAAENIRRDARLVKESLRHDGSP